MQFLPKLIITLCLSTVPFALHAGTSDSFILYDEFPAYGQRAAHDSNSFKMNEAGVTWNAQPVASNNFQVVAAPPAASSGDDGGSGGDSGGSDGGDGNSGNTGTSGGRRPRPLQAEDPVVEPESEHPSPTDEKEEIEEPEEEIEEDIPMNDDVKSPSLTAQIIQPDIEVELQVTSSATSSSSSNTTSSKGFHTVVFHDKCSLLCIMIALNIFALLILLLLLIKKLFS